MKTNTRAPLAVMVQIMLAAVASGAVHANSAAPPPPCDPVPATTSVQTLAAIVTGKGPVRLRECAAIDLADRSAAALPVANRMLDSGDRTDRYLASEMYQHMGPKAAPALPALMKLIASNGDSAAYRAVGAMGAAARPAIGLLIKKTQEKDQRPIALAVLGGLGASAPDLVVPHLIKMLKEPDEAGRVLAALTEIGPAAHAALPAILAVLARERASANPTISVYYAVHAIIAIGNAGESMPVLIDLLSDPRSDSDALSGLCEMGPAAQSAVPLLIAKLERSRANKEINSFIIEALAQIAPESRVVQEQLLIEATRYGSRKARIELAVINPLPAAHFAPAVNMALSRDGETVTAFKNLKRIAEAKRAARVP